MIRSRAQELQNALNQNPVHRFADYRSFLAAIYEWMKSHLESYSYLMLAEDLGFAAINIIRLVIAGNRSLAPSSAQKIVKALGLKDHERQYFITLVEYQNSKNPRRKQELFTKLLDLKAKMTSSVLDQERLAFFSKWYHPVIREMMRLPEFKADPDWIANHIYPKISPADALESLRLLEELHFVERDKISGKYRVCDEIPLVLPTDSIANRFAIIEYHRQMLSVAEQAALDLANSDRELNALTINLSKEGWENLKGKIHNLCQEALHLEKNNNGHLESSVVQLSVQMVRVAAGKPIQSPRKGVSAKKDTDWEKAS